MSVTVGLSERSFQNLSKNILAINSFTRESKHFGIAIYTKGIVKIIELENVFR